MLPGNCVYVALVDNPVLGSLLVKKHVQDFYGSFHDHEKLHKQIKIITHLCLIK